MIKAYLKYFKYVLLHKWYIFIYMCQFGRPIKGFLHDWDKFLPSMFIAYTKYFCTDGEFNRSKNWDKDGYSYKLKANNDAFELAWLGHIQRSKHHWQHWVSFEKDQLKAYEMPYKYVVEMVLDWKSAGKVQNNPHSTKDWYEINKHKMILHEKTSAAIESILKDL